VGQQVVRQTGSVLCRLSFDAGERALRLGLHCSDRFAVEVEEVIGETETRFHRKLPHRDATTGREVEVFTVLHEPTGGSQVGVDLAAGSLLGCFRHWYRCSSALSDA